MFSSEAISRNNMNINSNNTMAFSTGNYKSGMEGEFLKSKEMMVSSDNLLQQQQNNGGLTRYRSAPSTFFASFLDAANSDSSHGEDEAENMLSAFMEVQDLNETASPHHHHQLQFPSNLKQERMDYGQQNNGFTNSNPQVVYEAPLIIGNGSNGALLENQIQNKMNGNGSNNLIRQSSSPAGFFNGFDITRESNSNGLNNHQMNFASRGGATSRIFMPSIAENVNENTTGNPENQHIYVNASWNDSTTSNPLKRSRDSSTFNGLNNQNNPGLSHHLSLPKTSAEMAVIENYLQFEQNNNVVPCKLRAKRGCATHPRSVAERVRRTRISDRMKKLQELFPNMDKQTNTAEMLDLAVDYIKDLQKQVQTLTEVKAKCTC